MHTRSRRIALSVALILTVSLLIVDRTAAYLHRPSPDSKTVVIYTAQWCPYCRSLRALLDGHEIPYTEYDVEHSLQGGLGFWALRGRGVPVSVIGPKIVHGFEMEKIGAALGELGYRADGMAREVAPTWRERGADDAE